MTRRLIATEVENLLGVEPALATNACWDAAVQGFITQLDIREENARARSGAGSQRAFYASERDRQTAGIVARFTR